MYPVSAAYKAAMKSSSQQFRVTGTIGSLTFNDENILAGSFSITNQCSDGTDILIGQVYAAELNITLRNLNLERYSINTLQLRPSFGLLVGANTWEDIPLGVFNPVEVDHGVSGITIKAYDNMTKFDIDYPSDFDNEGTLYEFALLACSACGVELGTTEAEFLSMVNGSYEYAIPLESEISCYRDLVAWIAQCSATVAVIGRDGKLYFRQYHRTADDTIKARHRFQDAKFSDFVTRYTGVCLSVAALGTTLYISADTDTVGYTYNLGANPLLQEKAVREIQLKNIANALYRLKFVPFECSGIGNPAYDLMDVIVFEDGAADENRLSCITRWEFNYHGEYRFSGAGRNPALATAQSKTDKTLEGMRTRSTAHVVIDHIPTAQDLSGENGTIFLVIEGQVL